MRRRLLIVLLALGTVGGYGMGFAQLRCHARARNHGFERHVAKICADAARAPRAQDADAAQPDEPWDW
ncbi:MAG: hypothetical protein U0359_22480 [Byssovorax sp.]